MKKLLLITLLAGFNCISCFAQFKLSGKINNYTGKEELKINIPLVYGFYRENSINIPVSKNGTFSITLPVKSPKFANLIFQRQFHTLLLSPNKNLVAELNEANKKFTIIGGTARPENDVMKRIDLEENPFFMQNDTTFGKLTFAELDKQLIKPYLVMRDKKINIINQSAISIKNKHLIASEVGYIAYNYLNDFARTAIKNKSTIDSMIMGVFNTADVKPKVFPAGPQYYAFVRNYLNYIETKAFLKIKKENIKPSEAIPYYGISLDSANVVVKKYGKPYWRWIGSTQQLPDNVTEQFTYQQIISLFYDKDLRQTEALANAFVNKFPSSNYNASIHEKVGTLKALLSQNNANMNIKIVDNYKTVGTIYDVIKTFKGKVVYLDVWGTWCGPCKEELKYIPQLKSTFKDKDVAFVYLDMDEEDQDAVWKEFIKVNNLTGTHLRKNRQTIDPFWKELLANNKDKEEYYPQYFIFDKEGKLSVSKALRPSDKQALYQQISLILK